MDSLLDILQTIGIGIGVGAGSPLAALLVSALAKGDLGLDFEGTDWSFLESPGFMFALLVALMLMVAGLRAERRRGGSARDWPWLYGVAPIAFATLLGAGSMADRGHSAIAGLAIGAASGALAWTAVVGLLNRVRRRLETSDAEAASALPAYGQFAGTLAAGAAVLLPPVAVLLVLGAVWLLAGSRRREGEKYAGLRILR